LPCIEYFTWIFRYDCIELEIYGNYQKQTYSNRCYILSSQQVDRLTVPVIEGKKKTLYKDIQIDHRQKWSICHWRSISTAYGKAPYFEYLSDYFYKILSQPPTHLYQLNLDLLKLCLELLGLKKDIKITSEYIVNLPSFVVDARGVISPQTPFSCRSKYEPCYYQQVFGTVFNANLSILDLLFCEGPNAYNIIKKSCISPKEL
jgi:hypothetical protein